MSDTYGIIRLKKTKGAAIHAAQYHNDREPGKHLNPDIDPERTPLNVELIAHGRYEDEIAARTKDLKRKVRKDAVKLVDGILTASPEWFETHSDAEAMAFFEDGRKFVLDYFGPENIFYYTIHKDETTLHAHFGGTLVKDGSLSWKKFFPNKQSLSKFQDLFYEQVSSKYGMERGTKREAGEPVKRHKTVREFKAEKSKELDREIAEKTERLECLQADEIELGDQVEDLERAVAAVEAGDVGLKDAVGAAQEAGRVERENRDLEARARGLESGNRDLEERVEQLEQQTVRARAEVSGRERDVRELHGKGAIHEAEAGRLEKAGGILARALERGTEAIITAFTRLIRTEDLRRQDPGGKAWFEAHRAEYEAKAESVAVKPRGDAPIYRALAKAEAKLAKIKLGIRMGLRPKRGTYDKAVERRDQLDAQTPEAMQLERDYNAQRYIDGYAANIQRARGPEKADLLAKLDEIANDRSLSGRVRSAASRRASWIKEGAPSGSPVQAAGSFNQSPARRPQAEQGIERTRDRGAR